MKYGIEEDQLLTNIPKTLINSKFSKYTDKGERTKC